jgi:hypothetical protein
MGVVNWAFRQDRRYDTWIADHERGVQVDLIPARTSANLTAWLTQHSQLQHMPTTKTSRDAHQVTDSWHLLKNMRDVVKPLLVRRNGEIEHTWKRQAQAEMPEAAATTVRLKIPARGTGHRSS